MHVKGLISRCLEAKVYVLGLDFGLDLMTTSLEVVCILQGWAQPGGPESKDKYFVNNVIVYIMHCL